MILGLIALRTTGSAGLEVACILCGSREAVGERKRDAEGQIEPAARGFGWLCTSGCDAGNETPLTALLVWDTSTSIRAGSWTHVGDCQIQLWRTQAAFALSPGYHSRIFS